MMKYYAYYNHGGYKDLYLGNSEDIIESRYFLPLLKVHEESLKENPDETLEKEIIYQNQLPKLVVLSDNTDEYNYPSHARILFSHAGYKIIYRRLDKTSTVLAIRDIYGTKDTYGRQSPFSIMFISNTEGDNEHLNILAEYIRLHLNEFEDAVTGLFVNDLTVNGLRFDIGMLNLKLKQIFSENIQLHTDKNLRGNIFFVVVPDGLQISDTCREQNFTVSDLNIAYNMNGSSMKLVDSIQSVKSAEQNHDTLFTASQSGNSPQLKSTSLRGVLGVAKLEDIEKINQTILQLKMRVSALEERISNLENK